MAEVTSDDNRLNSAVEFIRDGLARGLLGLTVDRIFDLEQMSDAYRYLEGNTQVGKVIVRLPATQFEPHEYSVDARRLKSVLNSA